MATPEQPASTSDKEALKKLVTDYSTNVKNYAKWFEINQVIKDEDSYTKYNVIYRFLPKDLNESVKELNVLKRFRDFKELYLTMSHYHMSLHRKDKFPEFPVRAKYFGRFDDKIIEERKQCSLRLLQFIGSQGHLYRHEKFIEFFTDATFKDFSLGNDTSILKPVQLNVPKSASNTKLNNEPASSGAQLLRDKNPSSSLSGANLLAVDFKRSSSNLSSQQQQPNSLNDWIFSDFNLSTNDFNKDLALISGNLFDLNFSYKMLRTLSSNCLIVKNRHPSLTPKARGSGADSSDEYVLKLLSKSSNPVLDNAKCLVPLPNQVPFMCELVKYYESETTIFLLLEYVRPGKLVWHLSAFHETGSTGSEPIAKSESTESARRTSTSSSFKTHKYNNSVSGLPSLDAKLTSTAPKPLTTTDLTKSSPENTTAALQVKPTGQLVEVSLDEARTPAQEKLSGSSTSLSLSSSNSSLDDDDEQSTSKASLVISPEVQDDQARTVELLDVGGGPKASPAVVVVERRPHSNMETTREKPSPASLQANRNSYAAPATATSAGLSSSSGSSSSNLANKFAWPLNVFNGPLKLFSNSADKKSSGSSLGSSARSSEQMVPRALFKNRPSLSKNEEQTTADSEPGVPAAYDIKLNKYLAQVRTWLAQLLVAVDSLHRLGIECKNLCLDSLLLDKDNNLKLTYFSRWSLVDDHLNKDAIRNHFIAPELTGLVNQPVGKACDVWSFGVIAYELLTTKRFSDLNMPSQFYSNTILFPDEFDCMPAREMVKSILQLNPATRPSLAAIRRDRFFAVIDWVSLESSFWNAN